VSLAAAAALAVLAGAGCSDQSAAVRVGSDSVSRSDFEAELDAYASTTDDLGGGTPEEAGITGALAGSFDQSFVSGLLQQRVVFMLSAQVFESEGLELTDDDRDSARQQLESQLGGGLAGFPDDLADELVDDVARVVMLQDELGAEGFDEALVNAADSTDIVVNTRFGRWDRDQYTVVPPEGPQPAPGSDTTTPGDAPVEG
jgi:hypothetical protein